MTGSGGQAESNVSVRLFFFFSKVNKIVASQPQSDLLYDQQRLGEIISHAISATLLIHGIVMNSVQYFSFHLFK